MSDAVAVVMSDNEKRKPEAHLVSRRTAEVFTFRCGHEYASFFVDNRGSGYFALAIESSYGNGFAYAWSSPGECFLAFLADLDLGYVGGKMTGSDAGVFDGEATTLEIRKAIIELRRQRRCGAEDARAAWPRDSFEDVIDFIDWQRDDATDMFDGWDLWEFHRTAPGQRAREFVAIYETFWPAFAAECRKRSAELAVAVAVAVSQAEGQ